MPDWVCSGHLLAYVCVGAVLSPWLFMCGPGCDLGRVIVDVLRRGVGGHNVPRVGCRARALDQVRWCMWRGPILACCPL